MRAAAQICTGVGFIGAGVIVKGGGKSPVRGVTTACAVWVSAALGVVAASGMWLFALYSAGLSVTILRISRWYNRLLDEARLALTRYHPGHLLFLDPLLQWAKAPLRTSLTTTNSRN